jgi:hypothetical protein
MTDSITPPPELVSDWCRQWARENDDGPTCVYDIATQAARWGGDQELEACCEWVSQWCGRWSDGSRPEDGLRATRRPKPPSLKEQALFHFESFAATFETSGGDSDLIRRALEALPE